MTRRNTPVGAHIRNEVLPSGLSVTDAAKRLGIGRPALSNLLNGKASLSREMAVRLEKAFGADADKLLRLQEELRRQGGQRGQQAAIGVRTYVPPFLQIKAREIELWASTHLEARSVLAALLRRLVHSTGQDLRRVDFPAFDNAERHGWDGFVEAEAATAWVPAGNTGWEFGVSEDPLRKAEQDYAARLSSVPASERAELTFIFVTPRNWDGTTEWAKGKAARGEWKAVKAYDASNLEQWLEESLPTQVWLAEQLGRSAEGCESLDYCWDRWSSASEPRMSTAIFDPAIASHGTELAKWLDRESPKPFVVVADSKEEALAFLACLFRSVDGVRQHQDRVAVFASAASVRRLLPTSSRFVPVVVTDEAERELATVYRQHRCIVIRPRNRVDADPDIALDLPRRDDFKSALAAMGLNDEQVERLDRESGRSPTILRRRLSPITAIRTPPWANEPDVAASLIPMALVGAWNARAMADQEVLIALANRPYEEVDQSFLRLLQFDDCPVWSVGSQRGVAAKIDALFAVSALCTQKQLLDFLCVAEYVLAESDPALELPEERRWAASLYGKVRNHSAALRAGLCETLVVLSVHGNKLFQDRLGLDICRKVDELIERLLSPFSLQTLLSHEQDLPRYAEASPEALLRLLEADLRTPEPVLLGLLKPTEGGIFDHCRRTGLLWALEVLAWNPGHLPRVVAILAQLSRTKIEDNWMNKPIGSLKAIFRSWMPQTAASLTERRQALVRLCRLYPDIGWKVCMDQLQPAPRIAHGSVRPRWRSDASGAGQVVSRAEDAEFIQQALDLALAWPNPTENILGDLVERLTCMRPDDQTVVWQLIKSWATTVTDGDHRRAQLRERIRRFAFTRRGRRGAQKVATELAREAMAALESRDPVVRHAWLFANQWVELAADEADADLDFESRERRIRTLRLTALEEIWAQRRFVGVSELIAQGSASATVGRSLAELPDSAERAMEVLNSCLEAREELGDRVDSCLLGFLGGLPVPLRKEVLAGVRASKDTATRLWIYKCAPFSDDTWRLLDEEPDELRREYWREVQPQWTRHQSDDELAALVDRLLEAQRPRAAFHCVHLDWERLDTSRLERLLREVATVSAEASGTYQLDPHDLSAALDSLDGRAGVSVETMARLEFPFVGALEHTPHGIANIERQIAETPALFVQAVALVYKRRGAGEDPEEWRIENPEARAAIGQAAYRLLSQLHRIPGSDGKGTVHTDLLFAWISQVRRLGGEVGRADMVDQQIGQLMAHAPTEEDGMWPCRAVCESMEQVASPEIGKGFVVGVHNARGAVFHGEDGAQERELATKYQNLSERLRGEFPYVASALSQVADLYEHEARWHDSEARVDQRLNP